MVSVVRRKKGSRLPVVCSETLRAKRERELREEELQQQLNSDWDEGRYDGQRRFPIFNLD